MAKENARPESAAMRVSGPNDPLMQAGAGAVAAKKGKGISKIVLFSVLFLVLVVGISALGWWLRGMLSASKVPPTEAAADSGEQASGSEENAANPDAPEATESMPASKDVRGLLALDPFTVNLADRDTPRYMRMSVKLGVDAANVVESVSKNEIISARVRDAVLGLAASLTAEQVLSAEGKTKLRKDIGDRINGILPHGKVLEVYFLELVVQ